MRGGLFISPTTDDDDAFTPLEQEIFILWRCQVGAHSIDPHVNTLTLDSLGMQIEISIFFSSASLRLGKGKKFENFLFSLASFERFSLPSLSTHLQAHRLLPVRKKKCKQRSVFVLLCCLFFTPIFLFLFATTRVFIYGIQLAGQPVGSSQEEIFKKFSFIEKKIFQWITNTHFYSENRPMEKVFPFRHRNVSNDLWRESCGDLEMIFMTENKTEWGGQFVTGVIISRSLHVANVSRRKTFVVFAQPSKAKSIHKFSKLSTNNSFGISKYS